VYAATEEDFPSREELEAIQRGIEDIKQGRTFKMRKDESLDDFLNRIEDECNV
ncbi:prevent-host-death protein, partial [Bacteroides thetaiotaomicron]